MDSLQIAKKFAEAIKSKNIKKIILFGSVARGGDTAESDIDILIISDHGRKIESKIADDVVKIILFENKLVSAYVISEDNFNNRRNYFFCLMC